jgi:serine protease Do
MVKKKEEVEELKKEEVEKKDEPKVIYKEKDNNDFIYGILIAILIIIVIVVLLWQGGILNFESNKNSNVDLKYTETNTKIKEGVYVTDVSEIVEDVMPAIVSITSKTLVKSGYYGFNFYGTERYTEGAGSGIIVGKSDTELLILTNYHVVEDSKELSVQFINEKSYDATIKGNSERRDIAVISIPLKNIDTETLKAIKVATLGDSNTLKVGNGVIAIGNALGYGQSVTTGVVSALNRKVSIDNTNYKMIQIDAAINGGNSGGALLDSTGAVVGINSAKYSSSGSLTSASVEGMGFAIPISDVKDLITKLMNGEEDTKGGTIGIEGYIIEKDNNMNIPQGFYISRIVSGSGADKAGLEIGYVIVGIEGNKVEEFSDIQDVLYEKSKGDTITLTIKYPSKNEYKEKKVRVTLS